MSLVTLNEFKEFLSRDIADVDQDVLLQICLNSAEEFVANYTNITLNYSSVTITTTAKDTSYINVPYYPVQEVTDVKFDNVVQDITKFYIEDSKYLKGDISFPTTRNSVSYTVTVGYNTLPSDLKFAILKIADKFFTESDENRDGMRSYKSDIQMGENYIHNDLPNTVEMILIRYKKFYL